MKKSLLILLSLVTTLLFSQNNQTKDFIAKNWVTDFANMYTLEQEALLNAKISEYEKKTSMEIAIITVEELNDQTIEEYSYKQFNKLGIGKKGANNGLLIVFSLKDRASRVELGRGIEPFFTDYQSYDALETLKPDFKSGKYYDGTDKCLSYIISKLGNTPFEQKVKWLNEKKKKEAIEYEVAKQNFLSGLMWVLTFISFLGLLIWIYWLNKKRIKVKSDINNILNIISNFEFNSNINGSKLAENNLNILKAFKVNSLLNITKNKLESNEKYLIRLTKLVNEFNKKSSDHSYLINNIERYLNKIKKIDSQIDSIKIRRSLADDDITKIKNYGYTHTLNINIDTLIKLSQNVKNSSDVDHSIILYKDFESYFDGFNIKFDEVTSKLSKIKSSINDVNLSDNSINKYLKDIDKNKKWLKSGELNNAIDKVNNFNIIKSSNIDIISKAIALSSVLLALKTLLSSLSSRKNYEDDEKRRSERRRNESYNSSYSSGFGSSGSSDSGFGGFGGGSSGGGGASSSW